MGWRGLASRLRQPCPLQFRQALAHLIGIEVDGCADLLRRQWPAIAEGRQDGRVLAFGEFADATSGVV
jgi:hypothetical protein